VTGTFTALSGLKKYPVELTAIVSMTDSGGSNRVLRDEFGLLPTSDIRQCIVALASENGNETLRKLFTYRYARGTGISGMSFGNLFMAALTDIYGSQEKAIKKTCEILSANKSYTHKLEVRSRKRKNLYWIINFKIIKHLKFDI